MRQGTGTGVPRDGTTRLYVQHSKANNHLTIADATWKKRVLQGFLKGPSTQDYQIDVICELGSESKGMYGLKNYCVDGV